MEKLNALKRWDPFKEMQETQNRLARFFELPSARVPNGDKESMTIPEWAPSVEITEDDKEYLVKADLPEVKKEKITIENGVLTITPRGGPAIGRNRPARASSRQEPLQAKHLAWPQSFRTLLINSVRTAKKLLVSGENMTPTLRNRATSARNAVNGK
jgi:HSP20 family molecular chaperone IbpA